MANYVDNKKLFDCFVEWREARVAAEAKGDPEPQPPAYISESIMLIAQKYSTIWKFNGYSFREDMVGDAIIDIVKCFRNFDTDRSTSPLSYITRTAHNAFIRRIIKEKKQSYIKHRIVKNSGLADDILAGAYDDPDYADDGGSLVETIQTVLNPALEEFFEGRRVSKRKDKPVKTAIEDILGEEDDDDSADY